jgi:hypothetical protein
MRPMRSYPAGWFALLLVVVTTAACSSGDGRDTPPTTAPPEEVATPRATIYPATAEGGEQRFFALSCEDGTLTVVTMTRTIVAALPCDRLPPQDVIERFRSQVVEVEIRDGPPAKLFLRSRAAGSLEFTVEDIRIIEP